MPLITFHCLNPVLFFADLFNTGIGWFFFFFVFRNAEVLSTQQTALSLDTYHIDSMYTKGKYFSASIINPPLSITKQALSGITVFVPQTLLAQQWQ